jgi:DNA-binding transcriptional LysR family regulator
MDLRLVEIFCRVYKERGFSRAARELGLTQPTISAHVKDLEESLGTPLFNRLGREIQPTEAGRFLYEHAGPILALKRDLSDRMDAFLNRIEGDLTIGASSVPGEFLLPPLMTGFHKEYESVRVRLRITDTARTIDDLRHGEIELGVVGDTVDGDDLSFEPFASDALVLAVPGDWKGGSLLTLAAVRQLPLLIREQGSATRTSLERALAKHKLSLKDLKIAAELGSIGAIKEAVKSGHGLSFLSDLTITTERRARVIRVARVRELGSIERTYHIVVSRRHVLSPVTRAFLDHMRAARGKVRPRRRSA